MPKLNKKKQKSKARSKIIAFFVFLIFFCIFCWQRFIILDKNGVSIPQDDTWEVCREFIKELASGNFSLPLLFRAHGENTPAMTRLSSGFFFLINGFWNPFLMSIWQSILNSALYATAIAIIPLNFLLNQKKISFVKLLISLLAVLSIFAIAITPFNTNIFNSFLIQCSYTCLFGFLSLYFLSAELGKENYRMQKILLGIVFYLCACLSSAGGILASLALSITLLMRAFILRINKNVNRTQLTKKLFFRSVICLAVFFISYHFFYNNVANSPTKITSVAQIINAISIMLAFPYLLELPYTLLIVPLCVAPYLLTLLEFIKKNQRNLPKLSDWQLMCITNFLLLIVLAIAHGRGAERPLPSLRHMQYCALLLVANTLLLMRLKMYKSYLQLALFCAWLVFISLGLWQLYENRTKIIMLGNNFPFSCQYQTILAFLDKPADQKILGKKRHLQIPHPNDKSLLHHLQDPAQRDYLPFPLRREVDNKLFDIAEIGFRAKDKCGGLQKQCAWQASDKLFFSNKNKGKIEFTLNKSALNKLRSDKIAFYFYKMKNANDLKLECIIFQDQEKTKQKLRLNENRWNLKIIDINPSAKNISIRIKFVNRNINDNNPLIIGYPQQIGKTFALFAPQLDFLIDTQTMPAR